MERNCRSWGTFRTGPTLMAKRKQPEAYGVESNPDVDEGRGTFQGKETHVSGNAALEGNLMTGWIIGKVSSDKGASSSSLVEDAELVVEEDWEVETFWSLLVRAGYTNW